MTCSNNEQQSFNNTYLSTAIKWAIRNEVRRRYKWYSLKNKKQQIEAEGENLREEVYKTILSIDELQDAEVPTQIKAEDRYSSVLEFKKALKSKSGEKLPLLDRILLNTPGFRSNKTSHKVIAVIFYILYFLLQRE